MENKNIKVGVIGVGYWGPNLVRNFYNHPYVDVVGVCDLREDKLRKIKQTYKDIKIFTKNYKDILKAGLDLIAIATPPEIHYELARECLEYGVHILVEKPFTKKVQEAEELIKVADKKSLQVFVDHTFVFHPVVRKIKQIIDSGMLGEIYYFDSERVNLGLLQTGANVIEDLAIHDFSIISYLFPTFEPDEIEVFASKHVHPYLEDIAHIIMRGENNFAVHVHVSWLSPVKIRKTIIGGSKRMLWWNDVHPFEKLKIYESRIEISMREQDPFFPAYIKGDITTLNISYYESLSKEVENIVDTLMGKAIPEVDGKEGLKIVKWLERCNTSLTRREY